MQAQTTQKLIGAQILSCPKYSIELFHIGSERSFLEHQRAYHERTLKTEGMDRKPQREID
jgi:hypothetical protein